MKKFILFPVLFIFIIFCLFANVIDAKQLIWQETSYDDFIDNQLIDLTVKDGNGGEVTFVEPLKKIVEDTLDNSIYRFTSTNKNGKFIRTWVENSNIYVRKYNSDSLALSDKLKVNNNQIEALNSNSFSIRCALLDDGTFSVLWSDDYIDNRKYFKGQIFSQDNVKLDQDFEISNWASISIPSIYPDNNKNCFLILYPDKESGEDYMKIYIQKISKESEIIGGKQLLHPAREKNQLASSIISNEGGNYIVVWNESEIDEMASNCLDLYIKKYNNSFEPITEAIKVNDDPGNNYQGAPIIDTINNENVFVLWHDQRNGELDIYGQLLDSNLIKTSDNIKINGDQNTDNRNPEMIFENDTCKIIWQQYDSNSRQYFTKYNKWIFNATTKGEMISSVFTTGSKGADYSSIRWDGSTPVGTDIKFQLRSSESRSQLEKSQWQGPTDSTEYYQTRKDSVINPIHSDDNFIQYKALFSSEQGGITPVLHAMSITYQPNDSIPPNPPTEFMAEPGPSQIKLKWTKPEHKDLLKYRIYRNDTSGFSSEELLTEIGAEKSEYLDTSVVNGKQYFYTICSIDSSYNKSDITEEIATSPLIQNIYVSCTGSQYATGTSTDPYSSINQAFANANYGDTIRILPGSITENIKIKKGVSIIGTNPHKTTLNGNITVANGAVIKGLTITSNDNPGIICDGGISATISNNAIICKNDNNDCAILIRRGSNPVINKNYIKGFYYGIQINIGDSVKIHNNIIDTEYGIGSTLLTDGHLEILNNTIITSGDYGDNLKISGGTNLVRNNIFVGNEENTIGIDHVRNAEAVIEYNNFWRHEKNYENISVGEGNITVNPKFININTSNYKLNPSSPCIDAGYPGKEYYDTDGSRSDMGAFGGPKPIKINPKNYLIRSVYLSNSSGYPDDTISIYLSVDKLAGISACNFKISYNPDLLSLVNMSSMPATENCDIRNETGQSGKINIEINNNFDSKADCDSLLKLNFSVSQNAKAFESTQLTFENVCLYDLESDSITLSSITNGVFIVNQGNKNGRYIFVNSSNQEQGNGTLDDPFQSIDPAMEAATAGDTILVAAGEYYEALDFKNDVYLKGAGIKVTKIYFASNSLPIIDIKDVNRGEIKGFNFVKQKNSTNDEIIMMRNSNLNIINNRFDSEEPYSLSKCMVISENSTPTIKNNSINYLIIDIDDSSTPIISANYIEGNPFDFNIMCENSSPEFYDNYIKGVVYISQCNSVEFINNQINTKLGLPCLKVMDSDSLLISNNLIIGDEEANGSGVEIENSNRINIYNNIFYNTFNAIWEKYSGTEIYNNIFCNTTGYAIQHTDSSDLGYNCYWENNTDFKNCSEGHNNILADPLFQDVMNYNFQLQSGSPCINSGNPESTFNDKDGSRNDLGVYGGPWAKNNTNLAQMTSLQADSLEAFPHDTVMMKIMGDDILDVANIQMDINYNEDIIKLVNIYPTDNTNRMALTINQDYNSREIIMDAIKGISVEKGDLLNLEFLVATEQDSTININIKDVQLEDMAANPVNLGKVEDGYIKIKTTGIQDRPDNLIDAYKLNQNYPNPFNGTTYISFQLPRKEKVQLFIYDLRGRKVARLCNTIKSAGAHTIRWNGQNNYGKNVATGIYFYKFKTKNYVDVKKLLYIK